MQQVPAKPQKFLLYGATGYTGKLIAKKAVEQGLRPVIAGRNARKVEALAAALGCDHRTFSLSDKAAVRAALSEVPVVLHCAGPFVHTYQPMVEACIEMGVHYLDVTGEINVFESIAEYSQSAADAKVMLLPGVGMDVVPTDCLAARLKAELPDASHLLLAIKSVGGRISHGTAKTALENIDGANMVRRRGKLVEVAMGEHVKEVDFGRGPVKVVGIPWGDVSTAWYSTDIPNIEVYMAFPAVARRLMKASRFFGWFIGAPFIKRLLRTVIERQPTGPSARELEQGKTLLYGEVWNAAGEKKAVRLTGPQGYLLTAIAALNAVRKVLDGEVKPGFQTPSLAFGADFVLDIEGVFLEDV